MPYYGTMASRLDRWMVECMMGPADESGVKKGRETDSFSLVDERDEMRNTALCALSEPLSWQKRE